MVEILDLINATNFDDLIYYIKNRKSRRFDDVKNEIKLYEKNKIWQCEAREAKEYQNMFKLNPTKVKRSGFKSKEQKSTTQNIEMLPNARKKLSNYLMIILQLHLSLNIKQFMEKKSKY